MSYIDKQNNLLINNKLFGFLEYLFIIFTVLQCNSIYFYMETTRYPSIIKLSWHLLLVLLILILGLNIKIRLNKSTLYFLSFIICLSFFAIILFIINSITYSGLSLIKYFIWIIFITILLYLFSMCNGLKSLFFKFENIVLVLSVVSIIFWIISLLKVPTNINVITAGSGNIVNGTSDVLQTIRGYFYIYFIAQNGINFLGLKVIRNTGIFIEAPTYSSILDLALFIELFMKHNPKLLNKRCSILLLTIVSTTSTNGIIIAAISLSYAEMTKLINRNNVKITYIYIVPIVVAISIVIIYSLVSYKANSGELLSSFDIRMNDFTSTITAWKNHIFLGNGFGNKSSIMRYMSPWRFGNGGTTNVSVGFTNILAQGGLILGMFYIIPIILSHFVSSNTFGLSICLFLLFILEGISMFYIFNMMLMYLWVSFMVKNNKNDG